MQSRPPPKSWQSRSKTTTPALKTAAVTATKVAGEVEQEGIQESPVCAYNEWDPLEVTIVASYMILEIILQIYCVVLAHSFLVAIEEYVIMWCGEWGQG